MFLLVQNPGVAPVEGFTLLGVCTTRDCGVEGAIGQFGSGNKHAINVLLRAGLKVVVYCGKTRLDFQTRDDEIDDGLTRKPVKRVMCKLGGTSTRTIDLGWVLDFGAIDWTDLGMAMREFISNAIDRTLREENGEFSRRCSDGRLCVTASRRREGQGEGRLHPRLRRVERGSAAVLGRVAQSVPALFRPTRAGQAVVPAQGQPEPQRQEDGRDLPGRRLGPRDRGATDDSVYDYNFKQAELQIDECRNSSDYTIKAAIAKLYRKASAPELVPVFKALVDQKPTFEDTLDPHYICPSWETPQPEQQKNWQQAWQAVAADAVLCGPSATIVEFVERKGYAAKSIQAATS